MLLFDKLSDKRPVKETAQSYHNSILGECDRYLQTRILKQNSKISNLDEGLLHYGVDSDLAYYKNQDIEKNIKQKLLNNDRRIKKIIDMKINFI